jgi:hypothetical protein
MAPPGQFGWQQQSQQTQPGPNKQARRRKQRMCLLRIASHLLELENEDPHKVLIVRKIGRLGFDSSRILKEYFERHGAVSKVLLSNEHTKQDKVDIRVRLRPSGIGYVIFENAEAVAAALSEGAQQIVAGVEIQVRAFEVRDARAKADSFGDVDNDDADTMAACPTSSLGPEPCDIPPMKLSP